MFNKRGDIGYVTYLVPALMLLTIILIVFSVIFFVLGFGKSQTIQTNNVDVYTNLKLFNLLRSEINIDDKKISVADYLENIANPESELFVELEGLISKMPKPEFSNWHFESSIGENKFVDIGDSGDTIYFVQEINFPTKSGEIINSKLFLNCFGCSNDELREVL